MGAGEGRGQRPPQTALFYLFSTAPLPWAEICFVFMMRKLGILVGHRDHCHSAALGTVRKEFHRVPTISRLNAVFLSKGHRALDDGAGVGLEVCWVSSCKAAPLSERCPLRFSPFALVPPRGSPSL